MYHITPLMQDSCAILEARLFESIVLSCKENLNYCLESRLENKTRQVS